MNPSKTRVTVESAQTKLAEMKLVLAVYNGPDATLPTTGGSWGVAISCVDRLMVNGYVDMYPAMVVQVLFR